MTTDDIIGRCLIVTMTISAINYQVECFGKIDSRSGEWIDSHVHITDNEGENILHYFIAICICMRKADGINTIIQSVCTPAGEVVGFVIQANSRICLIDEPATNSSLSISEFEIWIRCEIDHRETFRIGNGSISTV